jgi:DNA-binding PadR family transcriptional regulator
MPLVKYSIPDILRRMPSRTRNNPLALAILTCLHERPMHPYEVAQTLRSRAKHESIRLNFGSLYSVVEGLAARGLVEARETVREGKRPERTVYAITTLGQREMSEWLAELVSTPTKEYLQFEAALSLIAALPPDDALDLLRQRATAVEIKLRQSEATHALARDHGLPRLFVLEGEYGEALLRAELEFVRGLVADIENDKLEGLDEWRSWYESDELPRQWFPTEEEER